MALSDRIKTIIKENDLKQKEFAAQIGVTESYISKLLRDESGVSNSTATLIEELYGYSLEWIVNGTEPKMSDRRKTKSLTPIQRKIIADIGQMNEAELAAVRAFITSLSEYQKKIKE